MIAIRGGHGRGRWIARALRSRLAMQLRIMRRPLPSSRCRDSAALTNATDQKPGTFSRDCSKRSAGSVRGRRRRNPWHRARIAAEAMARDSQLAMRLITSTFDRRKASRRSAELTRRARPADLYDSASTRHFGETCRFGLAPRSALIVAGVALAMTWQYLCRISHCSMIAINPLFRTHMIALAKALQGEFVAATHQRATAFTERTAINRFIRGSAWQRRRCQVLGRRAAPGRL